MLRFLRYIAEIIAALLGIAVICGLLLAWRLSSEPIKPDFLTPYIKAGIESALPQSKVDISSLLLTWDGVSRALVIHARDVKIEDAQNGTIAEIPVFDSRISLLGLLFGQIMPKELTIDKPQVKLSRNAEGVISFGSLAVGGAPGTPSSEPASRMIVRAAENLSRAVFTQKLAVTHALFEVRDEKTQKSWTLSVPEISIRRNGLRNFDRAQRYGTLTGRVTLEVSQAGEPSFAIVYAYDPSVGQHKMTGVFENITPARLVKENAALSDFGAAAVVDLPLTGRAELLFDETLKLIKASAQIHGGEGELSDPALWDAPCPVKSAEFEAIYNRATRKLTVSQARVDFGGPTLDIKIDGMPSAEKDRDFDFTAAIKVEKLPMDKYADIWPKTVLPNPRAWLTENLRQGTFDVAEVTLKGSASFDDLANPTIAEGGGTIAASGGTVRYIEGMPPVEGVGAEATFDLKSMNVKITGGGIGNIKIVPFELRITGLAEVDQYIDLPLKVGGPLPEVLKLLNHPPLMYAKAIGLEPNDLGGKIEGTVTLRFPLLKSLEVKDLDVRAEAHAADVASSKLVPGAPFDRGDLDLKLDTAGFELGGRVALGQSPFRVTWKEYFDPKPSEPIRDIKLTGTVQDDKWKNLGIELFDGTKGPVRVTLDVAKTSKEKRLFSGALDMTKAALVVGKLNWKKPAGVAAVLKFSAEAATGKPVTISPIELSGAGVSAKGSVVFSADMDRVVSFDFSPFTVGRTNAAIKLVAGAGADGGAGLEAKGASLDITGIGGSAGGKDERPEKYDIEVDRLYTAENGWVDKMKIYALRGKQGWKEISLHGMADGDMPLAIELTPNPDGSRSFKFTCDDFGKAVKGLGFTETVKKGRIYVYGQSTPAEPYTIEGKGKISKFRVKDLPALALLINATSPFGFSGLLTDSMSFDRLEGEFIWKGDEINVTRAHAAGSSIGINVDGKVDTATNTADLKGTLVPFSTVNSVLNSIPIIGDLITGGKDEGVLAVTYEIKGNLDKPKVSVNPVSLLTPGFIRNLFFSDEEDDEEEPAPEPEQKD